MNAATSLALLLAGGLCAQTRVVPADRTTVEGNTTHQYPFSYSEVRFQQIWEGAELANSVAVLDGIEFRADGVNATSRNGRNWSYVVTAAETLVSPVSATTTWANNFTNPGTVVLNGLINVPAAAPAYPTPQGFAVNVLFNSPFTFARVNGHFILQIEGQDPANLYDPWPSDAENNWRSVRGDAMQVSADGCLGAGNEQVSLSLSSSATLVLGSNMTVTATTTLSALANWIGSSNHTYLGLNLPFDLAPFGAPSCTLDTDIAVQQVGGTSFTWPIPNSLALENQILFTQAMALAPGANPGNLVTSDAYQVRIGGPSSALARFQTIFRRSNLSMTTGAMSGASFYGLIARFTGTFN
ncbi:MAG: hypothetical protein R3F56_00565 [Planctomycetota bacterium]